MSDYKRFTEKRNGKNVIPLLNMVCGVDLPKWCIAEESSIRQYLSGDAVDKFADLEDKIENGTLVELPCSMGDTVYCIYRNDDYEYWIEAEEVVDFIINDCDIDIGTACRMIGKVYREKVFLTKAEAEEKLREIKGATK